MNRDNRVIRSFHYRRSFSEDGFNILTFYCSSSNKLPRQMWFQMLRYDFNLLCWSEQPVTKGINSEGVDFINNIPNFCRM